MDNIEILKLLKENDILDESHMQDIMKREQKKYVLSMHSNQIWQGKDGKWYTYIQSKGTRKLKKRNSESELYNYLYTYYKEQDVDLSFYARFLAWIERQKICGVSDNTVHKYLTDFKRFFESYPIEHKSVTVISTEDIEKHFATIIAETKAPKRSIKCAFGYVNGVFEKCLRDGYIDMNPCSMVDLRLMLTHCSNEHKRKEQNRWITANEMKKFLNVLKKHMEENPDYMQNYAVFFSVYTGLRVGEISALRWKDVDFNNQYIYIHSSQKFNSLTKEFYNGDTKTHQNRVVPLIDKALSLLAAVKEIQKDNKIESEFVFANQDGQITAKAISECVRRRCRMAGIPEKSIHSIRRTLNSNMRGSGAPVSIASSIMGHSEEVNMEHYTNDLSSIQFRRELIQKACHYESQF